MAFANRKLDPMICTEFFWRTGSNTFHVRQKSQSAVAPRVRRLSLACPFPLEGGLDDDDDGGGGDDAGTSSKTVWWFTIRTQAFHNMIPLLLFLSSLELLDVRPLNP